VVALRADQSHFYEETYQYPYAAGLSAHGESGTFETRVAGKPRVEPDSESDIDRRDILIGLLATWLDSMPVVLSQRQETR